jgi:hypothetical protein
VVTKFNIIDLFYNEMLNFVGQKTQQTL